MRLVMNRLLRPLLMCAAFLCLTVTTAWAGDAKEVQAKFNKSFSEGSSTDKKDALRLAQSLSKEDDDVAFELLIKGVSDRQVHDEAVLALRARTGLQPTLLNRGSGYPGYPASDDASEWNNWFSARKKDKETQKKIADQDKKLKMGKMARPKRMIKQHLLQMAPPHQRRALTVKGRLLKLRQRTCHPAI